MNMGNIRFYGLLSALDDSESSPYCKLTLPKKMFRMQLRDYYRVSLTKISSSATLVIDEESTLQGTCRDISMSGAMITLPSITNPIEIGQTLDECSISIDDILELNFSGKIRSLHKTEEDILAGIQFLDLSPAQLKPISAALKKIERQNINT
jgi:c-di-GMP-binding flagellar brake protein YcgR